MRVSFLAESRECHLSGALSTALETFLGFRCFPREPPPFAKFLPEEVTEVLMRPLCQEAIKPR